MHLELYGVSTFTSLSIEDNKEPLKAKQGIRYRLFIVKYMLTKYGLSTDRLAVVTTCAFAMYYTIFYP